MFAYDPVAQAWYFNKLSAFRILNSVLVPYYAFPRAARFGHAQLSAVVGLLVVEVRGLFGAAHSIRRRRH